MNIVRTFALLLTSEIRSYIYQSLREQALDELQEDYYKKKIIDQIEITKKNDT